MSLGMFALVSLINSKIAHDEIPTEWKSKLKSSNMIDPDQYVAATTTRVAEAVDEFIIFQNDARDFYLLSNGQVKSDYDSENPDFQNACHVGFGSRTNLNLKDAQNKSIVILTIRENGETSSCLLMVKK